MQIPVYSPTGSSTEKGKGAIVDSARAKEDLEGAEVHDKRTENP